MVGRHKKTPESIKMGAFLRSLRKKAQLSQRQVEELAAGAVSNAYLCQIENGFVRFPSPPCLMALARIYRYDLLTLMYQCYIIPYKNAAEDCLL